jgi:hypothetical protein
MRVTGWGSLFCWIPHAALETLVVDCRPPAKNADAFREASKIATLRLKWKVAPGFPANQTNRCCRHLCGRTPCRSAARHLMLPVVIS